MVAAPNFRIADGEDRIMEAVDAFDLHPTNTAEVDHRLYGQVDYWDNFMILHSLVHVEVGPDDFWVNYIRSMVEAHWVVKNWNEIDMVKYREWALCFHSSPRYARGYVYAETLNLLTTLHNTFHHATHEALNFVRHANKQTLMQRNQVTNTMISDYINNEENENAPLNRGRTRHLKESDRAILNALWKYTENIACMTCGTVNNYAAKGRFIPTWDDGKHYCCDLRTDYFNRFMGVLVPFVKNEYTPQVLRYLCQQCGWTNDGGRKDDVILHMLRHTKLPLEYEMTGFTPEGLTEIANRRVG